MTGRFSRPPWPQDAATLWRCEIAWRPGRAASGFLILATPPGGRAAVEIGRSAPQVPLPDARLLPPPTEELCTVVDDLASRLLGVGWSPVMGGEGWFADRFVWRAPGDPPGTTPVVRREERTGDGR